MKTSAKEIFIGVAILFFGAILNEFRNEVIDRKENHAASVSLMNVLMPNVLIKESCDLYNKYIDNESEYSRISMEHYEERKSSYYYSFNYLRDTSSCDEYDKIGYNSNALRIFYRNTSKNIQRNVTIDTSANNRVSIAYYSKNNEKAMRIEGDESRVFDVGSLLPGDSVVFTGYINFNSISLGNIVIYHSGSSQISTEIYWHTKSNFFSDYLSSPYGLTMYTIAALMIWSIVFYIISIKYLTSGRKS